MSAAPLKFSAKMTFEVGRDGHASVVEQCTAENLGDKAVDIGLYRQTLLGNADLGTLEVYLEHNGNRTRIDPSLSLCDGTRRRMLEISNTVGNSLLLRPGTTTLVISYRLPNFFDDVDGTCYLFHFHLSLPDIPYLATATVSKTIIVNIQKPARFFYQWHAVFLDRPTNTFSRSLRSFDPSVSFEFSFSLSKGQHYHNAVAIYKRLRPTLTGFRLIKSITSFFRNVSRSESK